MSGGMKKEPMALPETHKAEASVRLFLKYKETNKIPGI